MNDLHRQALPGNTRPEKAMILAAGLGTRLKPWTDKHPKALALVNGKALLQRNIEYLQQFGISKVIVNVHHFAEQVVEAIEINKGWGSDISVSDETGLVLETGGGLQKAAWFLHDSNFVLMNVDVLTDLNLDAMIRYHLAQKPLATIAVSDRQTSRYFLFDQNGSLCGWRNTATGDEKLVGNPIEKVPKAFSGIHIIDPAIFEMITRQGKFSMVDVYLDLATSGAIRAFDHSGSKFIDVGKPETLAKASLMFN